MPHTPLNSTEPIPDATRALVTNLIHDLRQPLSNAGLSLSYLKLILKPDERAGEQLRLIEDQLDDACRLLAQATSELLRTSRQHDGDTAASDRTNSATAALV
jgi:hypothetical protein